MFTVASIIESKYTPVANNVPVRSAGCLSAGALVLRVHIDCRCGYDNTQHRHILWSCNFCRSLSLVCEALPIAFLPGNFRLRCQGTGGGGVIQGLAFLHCTNVCMGLMPFPWSIGKRTLPLCALLLWPMVGLAFLLLPAYNLCHTLPRRAICISWRIWPFHFGRP